MKKATMLSFVVILAVALVGGCATTPKGPTDEQLIQGQVAKFKDAMLSKNLDALMLCVSDSFYHPEVGGKAEAKAILQQGLDSGYTEGGELDTSQMKITIKDDTATVYPIQASSNAGSVTVGITFKKEKTGWMVTMIDVEGV